MQARPTILASQRDPIPQKLKIVSSQKIGYSHTVKLRLAEDTPAARPFF
jgi:hypothetical protein